MVTPTTPRPKRTDTDIITEAARQLAPKVKAWLRSGIEGDDTELSDIESDLVKAIRYDDDGYAIARDLDGKYSPDAALVEILDEAGSLKSSALSKAQAEWVKANNLTPPEIGTRVQCVKPHGIRKDAGVGTVTRNFDDGKSTVNFPALGHVLSGTGAHGLILEWESFTVKPSEPESK